MIKRPLVSIIIAVYNKEIYLKRFFHHILNQTYKNIEIIIIDDGSTDDSLSICKSFALLDNRVIVHSQKNKGIGFTRNKALKLVKGEYTIHSDPDDWIEFDMIELLLEKALESKADITICDFSIDFDNSDKQIHSFQNPLSTEGFQLQKKIVSGEVHGGLCNKLIRTDLYRCDKIIWPNNLSFCEDQLILLQILQNNPKINYVNKALYHYVQYENSATNTIEVTFINNLIKPYLKILKKIFIKENKLIYYTSCLFFINYLISLKRFRKREIYLIDFSSHFYLNKTYLDSSVKERLFKYFSKPEKIIIKILK